MNEGKKDYAKVTEVSAAFNEFLQYLQTRKNQDALPVNTSILLWQSQFQLIIAQQLTIIAGHLAKIVGKAEELKNGSD